MTIPCLVQHMLIMRKQLTAINTDTDVRTTNVEDDRIIPSLPFRKHSQIQSHIPQRRRVRFITTFINSNWCCIKWGMYPFVARHHV